MKESTIEIEGNVYTVQIENDEIVSIDECTPYNKTPAGMLQDKLSKDSRITVGPKCAHIRDEHAASIFKIIGTYHVSIERVEDSAIYEDSVYVQWDNIDETAYDEPDARPNTNGVKNGGVVKEGTHF